MFSERLEGLIKASLQDGVLTDQEKQAILKRAEAEGEDPNEVDIYIQSLVQKSKQTRKQKEDEKDEQLAKERKAAMGRVCPQCGKQVPPLTLKCDCGYEFTSETSKKASSVQSLVEKIDQIQNGKGSNKEQRILDAISLFPVPNTKEDIIDFLALSAPNAKKKGGIIGSRLGRLICFLLVIAVVVAIAVLMVDTSSTGDKETIELYVLMAVSLVVLCVVLILTGSEDEMLKWNKKANVWRAKFDQVIMKGRSLRGDADFQRQLDYFESKVNRK